MRALVIFSHPNPESFNAAVRDAITGELSAAGVETRVLDLYAMDFSPLLTRHEMATHYDVPDNTAPVAEHVEALRWADALIFVYPTWWYGLPAMMKGWLERVLLPGVAFVLGEKSIRPALQHIRSLDIFTTCGASWWLTRLVGNIGRRTILRGVRPLCHPRARTSFTAHFLMDSSTPESRARHLTRVRAKMQQIIARNGASRTPAPADETQRRGAGASKEPAT